MVPGGGQAAGGGECWFGRATQRRTRFPTTFDRQKVLNNCNGTGVEFRGNGRQAGVTFAFKRETTGRELPRAAAPERISDGLKVE